MEKYDGTKTFDIIECKLDPLNCYGSPGHASTCMSGDTLFPALIPHATVPPKTGGRVSLQIQFEHNPTKMCAGI